MSRGASACALALLLLLAGAGCSAEVDVQVLRETPDRVREAGSAQMTISFTTSTGAAAGAPLQTTMRAEGVLDFGAERGRIRTELSLPTQVEPGADLVPCDMLVDGGALFLAVPDDAAGFEGRRWVRVEGPPEATGLEIGGFETADPTGSLEFLRGASGPVEVLGGEEVDGVQTTHVRARIEVEPLLERADENRREQLRQQFEALGVDEFPAEVWLDDEDLPRRLEIALEPGPGTGQMSMTIRMQLSRFGEPVEVEIPPADDVYVATDITGAREASLACLGATMPPEAPPPGM